MNDRMTYAIGKIDGQSASFQVFKFFTGESFTTFELELASQLSPQISTWNWEF